MAKSKALAREDRLRQIMLVFAMDLQQGGAAEFTSHEIAAKVGLSASSKFNKMLEELVMQSQLIVEHEDMPGICKFRRIFRPNLGEFRLPMPKYHGTVRKIKITSQQKSLFAEAW